MKMDKKSKIPIGSPLISWCNRIIKLGFYLLFALVPLLLTPWNYELFEFNKMIGVYIITTLIVTSWIVKMILQKEIRISRTPLDIPIALFVGSQLISTLFSIDPHVSWFGYYSRFNGGMWSVISYVVLYYAYMSNKTNWTNETHLLKATLITGSLVALYGVLERLGIDKDLWVQDVQNRVFSTLGQPNWLAAYLVALLPLSMALALKTQNSRWSLSSAFWVLVNILLFTTLLFTRSRSGLLGFVVADVVLWGILFINFIRPPLAKGPNFTKLRWAQQGSDLLTPAILIHLLFALIVFINGTGTPGIDRYVTFSGLQKSSRKPRRKSHQMSNPLARLWRSAARNQELSENMSGKALLTHGKARQKQYSLVRAQKRLLLRFINFDPSGIILPVSGIFSTTKHTMNI